MPNEIEKIKIKQMKIKLGIDSSLYRLWETLPEPKLTYTEWYYGNGRFFDLLYEEGE